jgi:hypothetical protein
MKSVDALIETSRNNDYIVVDNLGGGALRNFMGVLLMGPPNSHSRDNAGKTAIQAA